MLRITNPHPMIYTTELSRAHNLRQGASAQIGAFARDVELPGAR